MTYGEMTGLIGSVLTIATGVGYAAVKYGVSESLKAVNQIRSNDLHHLDEKVDTLAETMRTQHTTISDKVDELQRTVDFKLGELKGLDLDKRVTRLEGDCATIMAGVRGRRRTR